MQRMSQHCTDTTPADQSGLHSRLSRCTHQASCSYKLSEGKPLNVPYLGRLLLSNCLQQTLVARCYILQLP